ncbi:HAMP domain-containing histidine kinase [Agrobacterium tumefaciens]|uniref:HAMP domain-containing sensor histidine kinase n=1 Tax=Agrobacterium TaxID=357 RepID=UPI00129754A1|nr:HAMP domain-containing sensor histidine kinase [Agrobacterium sp. ICMP 6402]MQB12294.1 sensor histidine kinase [Agrobacterium sp. ICMP 6402]NTA61788.1 HAMP domain-containing histidine kinase [Agrobacterium tumefaciens]
MRRLFWKFFTVVWLAMAGSIALLFAISILFESPFEEEILNREHVLALETAAQILQSDGVEAATHLIAAMGRTGRTIPISIVPIGPAIDCALANGNDLIRTAVWDGNCYQVRIAGSAQSMVSKTWPRTVPWLAALLAAAAAAYWLGRYFITPVEQLRYGLRSLANGQLDVRIAHTIGSKRDEITSLAHDLDITAARLQELQVAQQQLFHDVSHELRSPLSRLQAAIGVLQQNPMRLTAMIERMGREVERLDELVGEILTLARLSERDTLRFDRQTLDVVDLVKEIIEDAGFEGQGRGIEVRYKGVDSCVASVNGELIYRALENVIRNAIAHTEAGTSVLVASEVKGHQFLLSIEDEGLGVPEEELEAIFQPFSQSSTATARSGFGLGLAITRRAAEWHGGRATAQNKASGGLRVEITIPVYRASQ